MRLDLPAIKVLKPCLSGVAFVGALIGTAAFASDGSEPNIFHADLSHPDLTLAVSTFEKTCMPFVLHKTEMTPVLDRQHTADILESRDFELTSSEMKSERFFLGQLPHPRWKPGSAPLSTKGQFTVFNGVSSQVVQSTETIISQTGEIGGPALINAEYATLTTEYATYTLRSDDRLTANLTLFTPSQNPGTSCEIKLDQPKIDAVGFAADFIDKDTDWTPKDSAWTQCVIEGEDQFRFEVSRTPQTLAISMTRNNIYAPNICGSQG